MQNELPRSINCVVLRLYYVPIYLIYLITLFIHTENPTFAKKLEESKTIEFIGPPSSAILAMGSKSASKKIMTNGNSCFPNSRFIPSCIAGVPCVPGYHGENQDPLFLKEEATKMGYPVLIKAIKGISFAYQLGNYNLNFNIFI